MKKSKLTLERHEQLGRDLYELQARLTALAVELGNAFPMRTGLYKQAGKACAAISGLRSALDAQMFSDYPQLGEEAKHVYYPGNGSQ